MSSDAWSQAGRARLRAGTPRPGEHLPELLCGYGVEQGHNASRMRRGAGWSPAGRQGGFDRASATLIVGARHLPEPVLAPLTDVFDR
jgi:hypothetical protein